MYKKTPEYKEHMKNKEAEKRAAASMDLLDFEHALDKDKLEDVSTLGDYDPDSWQDKQKQIQDKKIQDEMSEILF